MRESDSNAALAIVERLGEDADTLLEPRATLRRREKGGDAAALLGALGDDALLLEEAIGHGGMGVVYLAIQQSLGRRVAVKQLRPEHVNDYATLKLLREAWVTGSLEHPNIVPIHDVRIGEGGQPQIVLKRIDGVPWSDVIGDAWAVSERFGVQDLLEHNLDVLMQISSAVHFAHSRGVVHRDLKPANVMIGVHGEVYLLDWGVAVSLREDPLQRLPLAKDSLEIAGTPGYLAPEQLRAEEVDERTDVYLLGAILHEILTGNPPHRGLTPEEVAESVLASAPVAPPGGIAELWAIVVRAMRPRREDRFESARAFRAAVGECRRHLSAIHLAGEAERRLEALMEVVASDEAPAARRAEAYELYGGCRFGFRQALGIWPDHAVAKRGIERAVEAMIDIEIGCNEALAASELLAELAHPPAALAAKVERALIVHRKEQRRLAGLEQLGEQRDVARGARIRRLVVVALGLSWTIAPLATALGVEPSTGHYPPMVVSPIVVLAGLAGITLWWRRELLQTAINRGVMLAIAVGVLAQLAVALTAPVLGIDAFQARVTMLLLWSVVVAIAAATIDRRLGWSALAFLIAFLGCVWLASTVAHVLYAMAASYLAVSLNALAIWRPREDSIIPSR
jgi:hypothetical protein